MIDPITNTPAPSAPASVPQPTQNGGIGAPMPTMSATANSTGATTSTSNSASQKKISPKIVVGLLALVLTFVGGAAGLLLSETGQDIRQQASEPTYNDLCIQEYGGNPMLMSQAIASCESNSAKNWDAVQCECVDDPNAGKVPRYIITEQLN
jgi:hypothetical protein